jgi:mRNA-degrading endonuclease toxin of MazEF toxin-antitoxin module
METQNKLEQIKNYLQETEDILNSQEAKDTIDFAEWTKTKADLKYLKKIPTFPITTHFIYWCNMGTNIGSEQNKLRPVIIVRSQTNSTICSVLPLTSARIKDNRWYHIDLEHYDSTAIIEHLRNISKLRILKPHRANGKLARISEKDVVAINAAIQSYYKLPPIP